MASIYWVVKLAGHCHWIKKPKLRAFMPTWLRCIGIFEMHLCRWIYGFGKVHWLGCYDRSTLLQWLYGAFMGLILFKQWFGAHGVWQPMPTRLECHGMVYLLICFNWFWSWVPSKYNCQWCMVALTMEMAATYSQLRWQCSQMQLGIKYQV